MEFNVSNLKYFLALATIFTILSPLAAKADCSALLITQEIRKIKMYRPIKIDDYNTLNDANCENSILKYEFILVDDLNVHWSEMKRVDLKALYETHAGVVRRQYCSMPKMVAFHPFLKGARFTYKTAMGKILYEIEVANKDCGLEE